MDNNKKLIVYFSYTGNTKKLAEKIQKKLGCDIIEIKPENKKYGEYEKVADFKEGKYAKEPLVKFNGTLYIKSNKIIDYIGGTAQIGTIDQLIDSDYVPKVDGETNSEELENEQVVAKFATTTKHGAIDGKVQTHMVDYYNLDMIISIGYRVKSQNGILFRK